MPVARAALLAAAVLLFVAQAVLLLGSQLDDPYIFARYARNLLEYKDLVWNPGEPRIEGFSSWAWLLVYVLGTMVLPDPVVFARCAGVVAGAALIWGFGRAVLPRAGTLWPGLAALAFLALSPDLAHIAASGMDHMLWALASWLYLRWLGAARDLGWRHGVAAGLGIALRPEGFLLLAPLAVLAGGVRGSLRRTLLPGLGMIGSLLLVRLALFGSLLPNAAAAKHFGGSLAVRVLEGTLYSGYSVALYLAVPLAALAVSWPARKEPAPAAGSRTALACAVFAGVLLAFVVVAGGDDVQAFGRSRLLTPAFAPAAYLLFSALGRVPAGRLEALRAIALLAVVLLIRAPGAKEVLQTSTGATNLTGAGELLTGWRQGLRPAPMSPLSVYLRRETPPGETIAVSWAGLVPYQTRLPVIDFLGLNDATIRRTPHLGRGVVGGRPYAEYLLERRPFFICDNYVIRRPLREIRALDDPHLRELGAYQPAQRMFLRDPRLADHYEVDPEAPLKGTCLRRLDAVAGAP